MELLQYEKDYKIHVYEIGPDGKLSLFSLFNFMQAIAGDHATKLSFGRDDLLKENRFWVLSRMYAVISIWPEWEETIIVRTYVGGELLKGLLAAGYPVRCLARRPDVLKDHHHFVLLRPASSG